MTFWDRLERWNEDYQKETEGMSFTEKVRHDMFHKRRRVPMSEDMLSGRITACLIIVAIPVSIWLLIQIWNWMTGWAYLP